MLLAKFYLNAEVYTGTPMWSECAEQCKEIVKSIPQLAPTYKYLFCAPNDRYVGNGEILWAIPQKVGSMETYGGTTYMTAGAYVESALSGIAKASRLRCHSMERREDASGALNGIRAKRQARTLLCLSTYNAGVENLDNYDEKSGGYMCIKYTYTTEDDYENTAGVENSNQMCDADYPLFRLADTYLMLAECKAQWGGMQWQEPILMQCVNVRVFPRRH